MNKYVLLIVLCVYSIQPLRAAVTLDAQTYGAGDSNPQSSNHTTAGDNRLIVLLLATKSVFGGPGEISGTPTFNSVEMTLAETMAHVPNGTSYIGTSYIYYLANPSVGEHALSIPNGDTSSLYYVIASFNGVDQTSPLHATAKREEWGDLISTLTIEAEADGLTVDIVGDYNFFWITRTDFVVGAGQTKFTTPDPILSTRMNGSYKLGVSNQMYYDVSDAAVDPFVHIGASFSPVGEGPPASRSPFSFIGLGSGAATVGE